MIRLERFRTSLDLLNLFQTEVNRFPWQKRLFGSRRVFAEFGGLLIRPPHEPQNRLTHVALPATAVAFLGANVQGTLPTDLMSPTARLAATQDGRLAVTLASKARDGGTPQFVAAFSTELAFNAPLWSYFSEDDGSVLRRLGFRPNMSADAWAAAIWQRTEWPDSDLMIARQSFKARTLPFAFNELGGWGDLGSCLCSPRFLHKVLDANCFTDERRYYETGSIHVHPPPTRSSFVDAVARRVGEDRVWRTVSPSDVRYARASQRANDEILRSFGSPEKRTGESFMSIVAIDWRGRVQGIQHHDFGGISDLDAAFDLCDRTDRSFASGRPDVGLVAEFYTYMSSSEVASSELGPAIGPHVGAQ